MISIRKSVSELERFEQLKRTLAKYYTLAIRSVADYAVDVDPRHTADFRTHLQTLEAQSAFAVSEEEYAAIQSSFRGELRSYRDFTAEQLGRMRAEIAAAAQAVQSFADDVETSGSDLEVRMKEEIAQLESTAAYDDLAEIRKGIHKATHNLVEIYRQLSHSNHSTVAQLKDELRALHKVMNDERRSIYIDSTSGAWIRPKLDERVDRLIHDGQAFLVIFVWAGFARLVGQHSKFAIEEVRKAMVKRIEGALQGEAFVARWSEEVFAAVIDTEPSVCQHICAEVGKKLAYPFSVQEEGTALTIPVEIRMAVVERQSATGEASFYQKIGEATRALGDVPLVRV